MLFKINLFLLFALAPFIGLGVAYIQVQPFNTPDVAELALPEEALYEEVGKATEELYSFVDSTGAAGDAVQATAQLVYGLREKAAEELEIYRQQGRQVEGVLSASSQHRQASGDLLDYLLANMLGDPIGQTFGQRATIKVYSLKEAGYRGKMAKVRLHDVNALRMVLAGDRVGSSGETTRSAAERHGAVLAVNAGGHFSQGGKLYPLGITVVNGEAVTFNRETDLSFVGFNTSGQLIGGRIDSREQIEERGILQGASFLPTLLRDGKRQPIPSGWANTRQPRTLIGHFTNGDLLFVVIDGRREGWSEGVTLEEAQRKLQEFNVRDAYNLDGGGSSTFYYDGNVINRPSDGRERRVTTNLVVLP